MDQVGGTKGQLVLSAQPHLGLPALYVHNLTGTRDAERILNVPPPIHPLTPEVLPRLRLLNPDLAANLGEKDSVKEIPFKLITTDQYWPRRYIYSFIALSYCWHGEEWEVPSRFNDDLQGWDFPISPVGLRAILPASVFNPYTARQFAMWIDQICIDQENSDERFHVIANMDTIYRNAKEVNILLEDVDLNSDEEAALYLLFIGDTTFTPSPLNRGRPEIANNVQACIDCGYTNALVRAMTKVFESRWFTRAWCRQEYMLNPNAVFVVLGRNFNSIPLDPNAFSEIHAKLTETGNHSVQLDDLALMPPFQDFSFGINDRTTDYTTSGCLFELFVQLQLLNCSYQKDIISISLNASGIRLSFNGDVGRQRECRYILALIALGAGDASVLGAEGLPMHRMGVPGHQPLLFWPREYEKDWSALTKTSMPRICADSKIWAISPEQISLDMYCLYSRLSAPPTEFTELAVRLSTLLGVENEVCTEILSCAFSIGLPWIHMVGQHLKGLWSQSPRLAETYQFRHHDILSTITQYYTSNVHGAYDQIIPISPCGAEFIYHLAHCGSWFAGLDETTPHVVYLNSTRTRCSIILAPKDLASAMSNGKYQIYVPVALNSINAFSVRRVWFLEKVIHNQRKRVALLGRGFLIGDGDLHAEGDDRVFYIDNVTIIGQWRDDQFGEDDSSFGDWDTRSEEEMH